MQFLGRLSIVLATTAAVFATPSVRVAVPVGLTTSDIGTAPAKDPGYAFVTIDAVRLVNPSAHLVQSYAVRDFHLLANDRVYYPSVRPGLGSLDLSVPGALAPGASTTVTVSFLVPSSITSGKFEFVPHWQSDSGATVDWCCYYL